MVGMFKVIPLSFGASSGGSFPNPQSSQDFCESSESDRFYYSRFNRYLATTNSSVPEVVCPTIN